MKLWFTCAPAAPVDVVPQPSDRAAVQFAARSVWPLALVLLAFAGCSSETPANMKDTPGIDLFQISRAYNASLSPPKDAESLRTLLQQFSEAGLMAEPEQVLTSPRDQQPYEIVYSVPAKTPESAIIAYEKVGADGTRFVLTKQGKIKEVTQAEFGKGPFPIGHVPPTQ